MKKLIFILLVIVAAFSLGAKGTYYSGKNYTYEPCDQQLSNLQNFKSKDNFKKGFSFNYCPIKYVEASIDTDIVSKKPFKSESVASINAVLPINKFRIGIGYGLCFEITHSTEDSKWYFTTGGVRLSNLAHVKENQLDSLSNTKRYRFFVSYDFNDFLGVKLIYMANPDQILKKMIDCGSLTLSVRFEMIKAAKAILNKYKQQ